MVDLKFYSPETRRASRENWAWVWGFKGFYIDWVPTPKPWTLGLEFGFKPVSVVVYFHIYIYAYLSVFMDTCYICIYIHPLRSLDFCSYKKTHVRRAGHRSWVLVVVAGACGRCRCTQEVKPSLLLISIRV